MNFSMITKTSKIKSLSISETKLRNQTSIKLLSRTKFSTKITSFNYNAMERKSTIK